MSYTPTNWANGKAPALNATNLNKIENELVKLDNIVSVPDITETTETTMLNSYDGRLLVDEIGGVCQQGANPSPTSPQEIKYVKGKNLLDCRGLTAQTVKGVTFTPIKDEQGNLLYIEANGTATANAFYYLKTDLNLPNGDYCLNGYPSVTNIVGVEYYVADANAKTYGTNNSNDTVFTSANNGVFQVFIIIKSGYTATNLRFYPMIRKATIADNTYVPYELLRIKTHGKNIVKHNATNQVINGVTFKPNADGSISVNGTATDMATYMIRNYDIKDLKYGTSYILSGCPNGGSASTFGLSINSGDYVQSAYDFGEGNTFSLNKSNMTNFALFIRVYKGATVNTTFYPMIREASVADGTYEPYTESSITLSNPIDLYGIGDVQDVITPKQIKRYWTKKRIISTMDIFRSSGWANNSFSINGFFLESISVAGHATKTNMLCTHAKIATPASIAEGTVLNAIGHGGNANLYINFNNCTTIDELKTFLDENEVYVYYQLATETTEELPLADQVALNSLATYDGITYLEFDAEVQPTFEGEYGTSKVGGYTLEGMLAGRNGELYGKSYADRVTALEATVVNNI